MAAEWQSSLSQDQKKENNVPFISGVEWRKETHLRSHREAKDKEDSEHGVGSAAWASPEGESEAGQIIQISIIYGATHTNVSLLTSILLHSHSYSRYF